MPTPSNSNEEPVPDYIANFNDIHGWYHAWARTEHSWRGWGDESRPVRLYYPASLQYNAQDNYNAIDGLGRQIPGDQPYACTINPSSGKFERLCVQTRDSFCTLENSTWDRTIIRNTAPRLFRLANFPLQAIPPAKRNQIKAGFLHRWGSSFSWVWPSTIYLQTIQTNKRAFDDSWFCQLMASLVERTREHICPFCTMVTDTHVWLEISGKTGEKFRKDV
jgi:hypothetical protein